MMGIKCLWFRFKCFVVYDLSITLGLVYLFGLLGWVSDVSVDFDTFFDLVCNDCALPVL